MQRSTHRLKLSEIGPHVKCVLCLGYLIDATTIVECLHSFCRSCLLIYLKSNTFCPICDVQIHKTNPLLSIKPDKTLQDIVYKLVPGLFRSEMRRRRLFYAKHPLKSRQASPEERGVGVERVIYSPDDSFSLSLEYYDLEKEREERDSWSSQSSENSTLDSASSAEASSSPLKRYLQCPALVTIAIIKKFIRMKFDLRPIHRVEVFHRHVSLANEYTLLDVAYIYTWKGSAPMRFFFRISEVGPEASLPGIIAEEVLPTDNTKSSEDDPTDSKAELKQHTPIASPVKLLGVQPSSHPSINVAQTVQRSFASITNMQLLAQTVLTTVPAPTDISQLKPHSDSSSLPGSSQEQTPTILDGALPLVTDQTEQVQSSTSESAMGILQLEQLSKKSIVKLRKLSVKSSREQKTLYKNKVVIAHASTSIKEQVPSILLGQLSKVSIKLQEEPSTTPNKTHREPFSNLPSPVIQNTTDQLNKTSSLVPGQSADQNSKLRVNNEHNASTNTKLQMLPKTNQQDSINNVLLKEKSGDSKLDIAETNATCIAGTRKKLKDINTTSVDSITEENHPTSEHQNEVTITQNESSHNQDCTVGASLTSVSKPKCLLNKLGLGLVISSKVNNFYNLGTMPSENKCAASHGSHPIKCEVIDPGEVKPSIPSSVQNIPSRASLTNLKETCSVDRKLESTACTTKVDDFKSEAGTALYRKKKINDMKCEALLPSTSAENVPNSRSTIPVKPPTTVKRNPNQQILTKNEEIIKPPMVKRSVYVNEALKRKLQSTRNVGDAIIKNNSGQKKSRSAPRPGTTATLKRQSTKQLADTETQMKKCRPNETSFPRSSSIEVKQEEHQEEQVEGNEKNLKKATFKKEKVDSSNTILNKTVDLVNPSTNEKLLIKTELSIPHSKTLYNNPSTVEKAGKPLSFNRLTQDKSEVSAIQGNSTKKETSLGVPKNIISPNHKLSYNTSLKPSQVSSVSYSNCHPNYSQQHVATNKKPDVEKVTSPVPQLIEIPKPGPKRLDANSNTSGLLGTKQEISQDPKQDRIGALDLTSRPQSKSHPLNYSIPSTTLHFAGSPPVSPGSSSRLISSQLKIPNLSRLPLKPSLSGPTTPQLNRIASPQIRLRRIGTPISEFHNRKNVTLQPSNSETMTRAGGEEANASRTLSLGEYRSAMLPSSVRDPHKGQSVVGLPAKKDHETPGTSRSSAALQPPDSAALQQQLEMQARLWGSGAHPDWFQDAAYVKRMETFMKSLGEMPPSSSFSNSKKCNR